MQTSLPIYRPTYRPPARWSARFIVFRMTNIQGSTANDCLYCGRELRYHRRDAQRFSAFLIGRLGSGVVDMPHSWATPTAGLRVHSKSCPGSGVQCFPGPLAIAMSRRAACASTRCGRMPAQASPAIPRVQTKKKFRRVIHITASRGGIDSSWEQLAHFGAAQDSAERSKISEHRLIYTSLPLLVTGQMVQHDAVLTVSNED